MAACFCHPDRPGIGVCMRCRRVICSACCTRFDGVNHCFACIKAMGRPAEAEGADIGGTLARLAMLLFGGIVLFMIFWTLQARLAP
jgi:hypothetical protein